MVVVELDLSYCVLGECFGVLKDIVCWDFEVMVYDGVCYVVLFVL